VDESIVNGEGFAFTFAVTDGNAEIPVAYIGDEPRPDLFEEGQGTVATGNYVNNVFQAHTIFAKQTPDLPGSERYGFDLLTTDMQFLRRTSAERRHADHPRNH